MGLKPCKTRSWGLNANGYPQYWNREEKQMRLYTRKVLEDKLGRPIKPGLCALHHCDNPACFEPTHLYEGTHQQNVADRDNRQRTQKGARHYRAKLTDDAIRTIRSTSGNQQELARRFGVNPSTIHYVRSRKGWKHLA